MLWYRYTTEYCAAVRKDENTRVHWIKKRIKLVGIMLNEVHQRENKYQISLICRTKTNLENSTKQIEIRLGIAAHWWGGGVMSTMEAEVYSNCISHYKL